MRTPHPKPPPDRAPRRNPPARRAAHRPRRPTRPPARHPRPSPAAPRQLHRGLRRQLPAARAPCRSTLIVTTDGAGIASHAGTAALTDLADRLRWTAALSAGMAPTRRRRSAHDPGRVLRDLIVSIADGGDCLAPSTAARARVTVLAPAAVVVGRVPPDVLIEPIDEGSGVGHAYSSTPEMLALHLGWLDADFLVDGPREPVACLARLAGRFAAATPAVSAAPARPGDPELPGRRMLGARARRPS